MTLLFLVQFLMGLSILVAASRQTWAFSRDGALPFSRFFRPISRTFGYIPLRAVWGCVFLAAVMGLLSLIAPAAAQALFSLAVAGNNLAWGTPIFCRVVWGQRKFRPGPFYTGRWSVPIAWVAVVFLLFGVVLSMFPVGGPDPTRKFPLTTSPYAFLPFLTTSFRPLKKSTHRTSPPPLTFLPLFTLLTLSPPP
jgi:amino acid transporter